MHSNLRRLRTSRRSFLAGSSALVAGLSLMPRFSFAEEEKKLNFYNWDTYIGETTLADFNAATGIEVKMDFFADNDELFAKLKAGNPGYDVIVPTNDNLERMLIAGMVMPIDHSKIPNMANIDKPFQDATFDPGRKHSMPYMWGTLGVGYRVSKVEGAIDSWKTLFDDDKYAGRMSLLGDAAERHRLLPSNTSASRSIPSIPRRSRRRRSCSSPARRTSRSMPMTTGRTCSPRRRSTLPRNGTATFCR